LLKTKHLQNSLLAPEIQEYIRQHEHADEKALVLKHKTILNVPAASIAEQIRGRRKAKDKIPSYYSETGILYPPGLNLEQSSSEETALFKSDLMPANCQAGADLTGGFGIDSLFLSRRATKWYYVEPNAELLTIARHNHVLLGASNIEHVKATAEQFLENHAAKLDFVFIDPSRRSASQQKTYRLSETEPDITKLQNTVFDKANTLLIKASPWLDIRQGLAELNDVKDVFVVSTANECKEILFLCRKGHFEEPQIITINLTTASTQEFVFTFSQEKNQQIANADPGKYLYEPNASILKAGAFKTVAAQFNLSKISGNTHLYTGELVLEFPGRVFEVSAYIKSDAKTVHQHIKSGKANVLTRNYPLSPEELKKKLKLNDGGEDYLIAFSGTKEKYLAIAKRLK